MKQKNKYNVLIMSLISLAVGIFFCTCSHFIVNAVGWAIGAVLTLTGIVALLIYFLAKGAQSAIYLTGGIIFSVVGIFFLISQSAALKIIPIALGIILIIISTFMINSCVGMKRMNYKYWWIPLIFALVIICAGLFMIFRPGKSLEFSIIFVGIALIVDAVMGVITFFFHSKAVGQYVEADYREIDTQE